MCSILEYLHALKPPVIHRDFTPENLILRHSNELVLIDFNVAQQRESTATKTVVGHRLLTVVAPVLPTYVR
jgi:serine/threonine-protein kinase